MLARINRDVDFMAWSSGRRRSTKLGWTVCFYVTELVPPHRRPAAFHAV